jgi:hypothetical protein
MKQIILTLPENVELLLNEAATRHLMSLEGYASHVLTRALQRGSRHQGQTPYRRKNAAAFLHRLAAEKTLWVATDLWTRAREDGVSRQAIFEAKEDSLIEIRRRKMEESVCWIWDLSQLVQSNDHS